MKPIKKILVPLDFSAHSDQALDRGIELARLLGATIDLVHALEFPVPVVTPYEVAIPDGFLRQTREEASKQLAKAEQKVRGAGIEVKAHLTEAAPGTGIAQVAEDLGSDLIVMGTRGNTGLKHIILGSVAERTVRTAPCSVLTVKGEDD